MRRPWIKIEVSTPDKPEICTIATKLRIDPDAVVGKLVRLWSWAELSGIDPHALSVTKEFLDKVCGKKGFADALIHAGWLLESEGQFSFPHFNRHNGNASKVRGLTARRVEQHRARKNKADVLNVTKRSRKKSEDSPTKVILPSHVDDIQNVITHANDLVTKQNFNNSSLVTVDPDVTTNSLTRDDVQDEHKSVQTSILMESAAVEEKPKKRRVKTSDPDEDQPMLF